MKIAIKEPNKILRIEETTERYRHDAIKPYINENSLIEYVRLSDDGLLNYGVAEDGLMINLPHNFYQHCNSVIFPAYQIVGTAVFVRCKPLTNDWDYEIDNLTEDDIRTINMQLADDYQAYLKRKYID